MSNRLNFCGIGKKPAFVIDCDCCGRRSIVSEEHKCYCPVCGPDVITPVTVTKLGTITIPSKELAELQDDLQMALVSTIRCYGQGIAKRALDIETLDKLYLDADYRHAFEDLIDRMLKDAFDIEYASDGTYF